jgi:hypothetical protein
MNRTFSLIPLALVCVLASGALHAQMTDFNWAKQAGGPESDVAFDIKTDEQGNSIVTGYFTGTATFDQVTLTSAGNVDVFLAKYDPSGNVIWATRAGGSEVDYGLRLALDVSGNILIIGVFSRTMSFGTITLTSAGLRDIFIAKYAAAGKLLWARSAGGLREDFGKDIATDYSGAIYITGDFEIKATFGDTALISVAASRDIFIARLDANGNWLWARRVGGPERDEAGGITAGQFGSIHIAGQFRGSATFGEHTLTSFGESDIFMITGGYHGDLTYIKQIGGPSVEVANRIFENALGNTFLAGKFHGTITIDGTTLTSRGSLDLFVMKFEKSGPLQWAKSAGPVELDSPIGLALDKSGNIWVSGSFFGEAAFDNVKLKNISGIDAFIVQYDAYGGVVRAEPAGGRAYEYCYGIAIGKDGNPIITGEFDGLTTFGRIPLSGFGSRDIFLAKRAAPPDPFTKITTGTIPTDGGIFGHQTQGSSWVDYDNDDDLDLFIANVGDNVLYRNDGNGAFLTGEYNFLFLNDGESAFTRVTTGDIGSDRASSNSATWGDYDNDGDLDLFVATDERYSDLLYSNNGNGTFTRIVSGAIVENVNNAFSCS